MSGKNNPDKDILKQIENLPTLRPKGGLSPAQLAERACFANTILHQAHQIYWKNKHSTKAKEAWLESVENFHQAVSDVYPKGFFEHFEGFCKGEQRHLEMYLSFLELNLWFFRSGYLKADIMRVLKRTKLDDIQTKRVRSIILDAIKQHYRREFRSYCRLAQKVDCSEFRLELDKLLNHEDKDISRRASWVLEYCERK